MKAPTIRDVVCVIGTTKDNKPIWKKVGIITQTKSSGREVILLDRTFNPAGVAVDEHTKTSVPLYFFEQDNKQANSTQQPRKETKQGYFSDFEDDIPF